MSILPTIRPAADGEQLQVIDSVTFIKLASEQSGGLISVFRTDDPPKSGPPVHIHSREDESFFVIEGEYLFQIGDKQHKLRAGDFAFGPRGIPHTYANAGSIPGSLLVVATPGGFEGFFREVDALSKAGTASPETLTPVVARYGLQFVGPPLFAP